MPNAVPRAVWSIGVRREKDPPLSLVATYRLARELHDCIGIPTAV